MPVVPSAGNVDGISAKAPNEFSVGDVIGAVCMGIMGAEMWGCVGGMMDEVWIGSIVGGIFTGSRRCDSHVLALLFMRPGCSGVETVMRTEGCVGRNWERGEL